MIKTKCGSCAVSLQVKETLAGKTVKCPKCQNPLKIPDLEPEPEAAQLLDFEEEEEEPEEAQVEAAPIAKRVTCPMCGAKNSPAAAECKACGEPLSQQPDRTSKGVWRDGKQLVMSKTATLPYRCIKTNGEAELLLRRKLSWHHPLIYLTICGGLLIYIILAIVLSKKADIQVPICQRIRKRRLRAILFGWLCGFGGIGIMIAGAYMTGTRDLATQNAGAFVIIGGILFGVISAVVGSQFAALVSPAKITDKHVWLKGVHPDYLAELPAWPGE